MLEFPKLFSIQQRQSRTYVGMTSTNARSPRSAINIHSRNMISRPFLPLLSLPDHPLALHLLDIEYWPIFALGSIALPGVGPAP